MPHQTFILSPSYFSEIFFNYSYEFNANLYSYVLLYSDKIFHFIAAITVQKIRRSFFLISL